MGLALSVRLFTVAMPCFPAPGCYSLGAAFLGIARCRQSTSSIVTVLFPDSVSVIARPLYESCRTPVTVVTCALPFYWPRYLFGTCLRARCSKIRTVPS